MRRPLLLLRAASQAFFLGTFLYVLWSTTYPLTGLVRPAYFFTSDPLIMSAVSLAERVLLPGAVYAAAMLLLTLVLGRFFCGWVCPLGTLIDLSGRAGRAQRTARALPSPRARRGRLLKFWLLGVLACAALAGVQWIWPFDPIVIMGRFVSLNVIPGTTLFLQRVFVYLLRDLGLYAQLGDLYHLLKRSVLGVNPHFFVNSFPSLATMAVILMLAVRFPRFWCRVICPLGGMYALAAVRPFLRRRVDPAACTQCGACERVCRMNAIGKDATYVPGECVLCMDCVYACPARATRFSFGEHRAPERVCRDEHARGSMSRREFLLFLGSSLFVAGSARAATKGPAGSSVIRPPGSLAEHDFLNRCVRCGNCMKVCVTNGLQPVLLESGLGGIWTPRLVPETGYCEYNCALCGTVCPTGAIPRLDLAHKQKTRLGVAVVDKTRCLAWGEYEECLVCEEHCPVPEKAIQVVMIERDGRTVPAPVVVEDRCIGCGICQNKCPVQPVRAIRVSPHRADRRRAV